MKDVKELLVQAFQLAKKNGLILNTIEFESISAPQLNGRNQYVELRDINITATAMRENQE